MSIPVNNAQMKSLIDITFNQKYGQANTIDPIIEGNFLKDFVDFNASQFALASSLNNVNNTSDINKPVSTAQAAADAIVLASAQAYADSLVIGLLNDRGNYDASTNLYPATGGSGSSGSIKKGDIWTISVAGTLGGNAVTAGDTVRALSNAPGQTSGNWAIAETNFGYVPLNSALNLSDIVSASAARTNLGLGALAVLSTATPATGGTGLSTYNTGDIIYASATNVLSKLAAGTNGHVLTLSGGVPTWAAPTGGGSSLSSIMAASTTNSITNGNFLQEWKWNTLTGDAFKLSTNSTIIANGSTFFGIECSGSNLNTTNYAVKISNTRTGTNVINYGIDILNSGSNGIGINLTGTGTGINLASGYTNGIQLNSNRMSFDSSNTGTIQYTGGALQVSSGASRTFNLNTGSSNYWLFGSSTATDFFTINRIASGSFALMFGGDYFSGNYRSESTSSNVIRASGGTLSICANTGSAGSFGIITPNPIITVYGTNQNIGIGTTTPVASAKFEVSSTTQGVLITRMTGLQAEAISSPATMLLVAITNGNGSVITSTGFWYYDGSTWIKL